MKSSHNFYVKSLMNLAALTIVITSEPRQKKVSTVNKDLVVRRRKYGEGVSDTTI